MCDAENSVVAFSSTLEPEGHRSVAPMPSADELAQFYANTYFQELPTAAYQHSYSEEELAHRRLRADMLVHQVAGILPKRPHAIRLLDVGFGEGFELASAVAAGMDVVGVDYSPYALERFHPELSRYTRIDDPMVVLSEFRDAGETFDACVLRNVVEHVREPRALLASARAVLTPDGVVVVTVPNDYSDLQAEVLARGLSDREYWFAPPQHLQYFNTNTFPQFAASCGLRVEDMVGDFPIEMFLFHPGSNYVRDPALGKAAHRARVALDLFAARRGLAVYVDLCRAYARAGLCRAFTAFLRRIETRA